MKHYEEGKVIRRSFGFSLQDTPQTRDAASGSNEFEGYAIVFDSPSEDMGFIEFIAPEAFRTSLDEAARSARNIFALWSHDPALSIGSTRSKTLALTADDKGIRFKLDGARLNNMQRLSLETGDMQMSFGFIPRKVEYDEDANTVRILEAELLEVSPVIWPAYSASSAGPAARSIDQAEVDSPEIEKISEEIESPSVDNNELLRESYLQYFAHIAPKPHE